MPVYNFKTIAVVPPAKEFVDIILSKTQRKTPTVVHKGYSISRIRAFYMRKVKFTQQSFHDKITQLLEDFPRLDDIHPFYADLINILYSRDHYKLALGQISTAKNLIDKLAKDYLQLLKFADSLYRCKELKRAAMGRMATLVKKLAPSLGYLEEVRKHLSRLPAIDPNTRTLMVTGYPNVGKSSFMNRVSRANVDVQPYAFTTKSLFVGHFDYKYTRWQVIDTPGILDHPLEDRNTIEMQAITALAHLQSTVLYFVDISETCGYSIKQQVALFHNIKPLFANKPLLIVANKTDLKQIADLDAEDRELIASMTKDKSVQIIPMSNQSGDGLATVTNLACDMLIAHRVEHKVNSRRIDDVKNRIHIAQPVKRDNKVRTVAIPESVRAEREAKKAASPSIDKDSDMVAKRKTEKEIELEHGGPGVYNIDLRKKYLLDHDDWKFDVIPEIMDGKNIADFIDPDIEERLAALELEEEELEAKAAMDDDDEESGLDDEQLELADKIRTKQRQIKLQQRMKKSNNGPVMPRTSRARTGELDEEPLQELGLDTSKLRRAADAAGAKQRERSRGRKRTRDSEMEVDEVEEPTLEKKLRAKSRPRSRSRTVAPADQGLKDETTQAEARRMLKLGQRQRNRMAKAGEADRHVGTAMPKHLFAGKRPGHGTASHR